MKRKFIGNFPCLWHYERMNYATIYKKEYRNLILSLCKHHGVTFHRTKQIVNLRRANQQISIGLEKEEEYDSFQEIELYNCSYLCNVLKNNIMCTTCLLSDDYNNDNYDTEIQLLAYVICYGTALTRRLENIDYRIALRSTVYLGTDYSDWFYYNFTFAMMQTLLENEEFLGREITKENIDSLKEELCERFYKSQNIEERYDPERRCLTKMELRVKEIYQAAYAKQQGPKKTINTIHHEFMELYHQCCPRSPVQESSVNDVMGSESDEAHTNIEDEESDEQNQTQENEIEPENCPSDTAKDKSIEDESEEEIPALKTEQNEVIPTCKFDKNLFEPLPGDSIFYPKTLREFYALDYELIASDKFSVEVLHVKNETVDKDCLVIYLHYYKKYYVLDCDENLALTISRFYLKTKKKIKYTFSPLSVYEYCDRYHIVLDNIYSVGYVLNEEMVRHGDAMTLSKFFLKRCVSEKKIIRNSFECKLFYMMKYYVHGIQNLLPKDSERSKQILKDSENQCHFEHLLSLRSHLVDYIDYVKEYEDVDAFIRFQLRNDSYRFYLSEEAKNATFVPKKSCVIYTIYYGNDNYKSRFFSCYYLFCIKLIKSGFWMECLPIVLDMDDKKMKILVDEKNHNQAFTVISRWMIKIARAVFDDVPIANVISDKYIIG